MRAQTRQNPLALGPALQRFGTAVLFGFGAAGALAVFLHRWWSLRLRLWLWLSGDVAPDQGCLLHPLLDHSRQLLELRRPEELDNAVVVLGVTPDRERVCRGGEFHQPLSDHHQIAVTKYILQTAENIGGADGAFNAAGAPLKADNSSITS